MSRTTLLKTDSAHGLVLLGLSTFPSFHHWLYHVWSQYEAHDRMNVINLMRLLNIFFSIFMILTKWAYVLLSFQKAVRGKAKMVGKDVQKSNIMDHKKDWGEGNEITTYLTGRYPNNQLLRSGDMFFRTGTFSRLRKDREVIIKQEEGFPNKKSDKKFMRFTCSRAPFWM